MAKKALVPAKVNSQEEELLTAKASTEKRLFKLIDKYESLGEEIQSTKLTLDLIVARMDELGICEDTEE